MIRIIENIYNDILEISDIKFQEKAWLQNSENVCSSFTEVMCRLFDDNNFDLFVDVNAKIIGFDSTLISELEILRRLLNSYKEKNNDSDIIQDPKWLVIVAQAKVVIALWDKIGIYG